MALALMGSSYGETEPKKSDLLPGGTQLCPKGQKPTSLELIPAASSSYSGKSLGNPMVELATPKGTNNRTEGTNKNESKV
jgi:hypothetical protein